MPSDDKVQCEIVGLDAHYPTTVDELHPETDAVIAEHPVWWDDKTWLSFTPVHPAGVGVLRSRNFEPRVFAWAEGSCLTLLELTPTPSARVVLHAIGEPLGDDEIRASVMCQEASGRRVHAGSGRVTVGEPTPITLHHEGDCSVSMLQVMWGQDLISPTHALQVRFGRDYPVQLEVPQPPPLDEGDPGWQLADAGDYLRVQAVVPGSPAARAGIRPGDHLLSVHDAEGEVDPDQMAELPVRVSLATDDGPVEVHVENPAP